MELITVVLRAHAQYSSTRLLSTISMAILLLVEFPGINYTPDAGSSWAIAVYCLLPIRAINATLLLSAS